VETLYEVDVCKTIVGGRPREVASVRKRGSPGEFRAVTPNFLDVVVNCGPSGCSMALAAL
jgi:hypothetical protein